MHKSRFQKLAVLVVLAFGILIFRNALLTGIGSFLVKSEKPESADLILVLAGDGYGHRILTAAKLATEGYAAKVLVSGPAGAYGNYECDLAIPFAVRSGYRQDLFIHAEHSARSTQSEAAALVPQVRALRVRKVLLVTSNYHTRRAGKLFRQAAPDLSFTVVASPDEDFTPDAWWKTRDGQKTCLIEWEKTVATWLGL